MSSRDVARSKSTDVWESLEVTNVSSEDSRNAVHFHYGYEASVMDLHAFHAVHFHYGYEASVMDLHAFHAVL
jgi:hypothetical protein